MIWVGQVYQCSKVMYSSVFSGRSLLVFGKPYRVPGIEPGLAACLRQVPYLMYWYVLELFLVSSQSFRDHGEDFFPSENFYPFFLLLSTLSSACIIQLISTFPGSCYQRVFLMSITFCALMLFIIAFMLTPWPIHPEKLK